MALLEDIAEQMGVSRRTVAAVLSGQSQPVRSAAQRRARQIRALADQMGYRPNAAARAISTGRFHQIGLLVGTGASTSTVPWRLERALTSQLAEHDLQLVLARLSDQQLTDPDLMPRILRERAVDGLLIGYTHAVPPPMIDLIERHRIPAVWLNIQRDHDCVYLDDRDAARRAAQHLIDAGRQRIAYVDFSRGRSELADAHYSHLAREAGYRDAMHQAGREPWVVRGEKNPHAHQRLNEARRLLEQADRPDAVLGYSEGAAAPFLIAALQQGIAVQDDLALFTFADAPLNVGGVDLPTLLTDHERMGRAAVDLLLRKIEHPEQDLMPIVVPFSDGDLNA
ncbi:MAG: LacI family DNA-binding transcriptional regulator [Phycisphaeraceae bacterium]